MTDHEVPRTSSSVAPWEARYRSEGKLWGDDPSELAVVAAAELAARGLTGNGVSVLDIGCGYGRDALYLWRTLGVEVVGIDPSATAIAMADGSIPTGVRPTGAALSFARRGFAGPWDRRFDVVTASNLFQLLPPADRERFPDDARRLLRPGGLLFLSTLSLRDPEHAGAGHPEPGGPATASGKTPLHFSTEEELRGLFAGLRVERLVEREYDEPQPGRATHHHISWILVAAPP